MQCLYEGHPGVTSGGKKRLDLGVNELRICYVDAGARHVSPKRRNYPEARLRNAGRIGLDVLRREKQVGLPSKHRRPGFDRAKRSFMTATKSRSRAKTVKLPGTKHRQKVVRVSAHISLLPEAGNHFFG